jgi:hypothetical protein
MWFAAGVTLLLLDRFTLPRQPTRKTPKELRS